MKANYEELVSDIEPDCYEETKTSIKTTWTFDEFYILKLVDKETGQIHWRRKVRKGAKAPNRLMKVADYCMVFDGIAKARQNKRLSFDEAGLLHALIERIEWEDNYVYDDDGNHMSIRKLSEYINADKNWTLNTLKSLHAKGFITIKASKKGSSIFVNPQYAWKGYIENKPSIKFHE